MWDSDKDDMIIPFDLVDEFLFDYTDKPGQNPRIVTVPGIRDPPKSRYVLVVALHAMWPAISHFLVWKIVSNPLERSSKILDNTFDESVTLDGCDTECT